MLSLWSLLNISEFMQFVLNTSTKFSYLWNSSGWLAETAFFCPSYKLRNAVNTIMSYHDKVMDSFFYFFIAFWFIKVNLNLCGCLDSERHLKFDLNQNCWNSTDHLDEKSYATHSKKCKKLKSQPQYTCFTYYYITCKNLSCFYYILFSLSFFLMVK